MSSNAYSAEFEPDPLLRRTVLWSGVMFAVVGILVIMSLPASTWLLLAMASGWVALSIQEIRGLRESWSDCHRLRISPDQDPAVLGADGEWHVAGWESGGILLRRVAWIRLRNEHGVVFGEPLRGDARTSRDWRRLQVIWRHVGAGV